MIQKAAFLSGVQRFCKRAGMDSDDSAQMERLLLMAAEEAHPIVKEARLAIGRINYVRAGMALSKRATYAASDYTADAKRRVLSGESWQSAATAPSQTVAAQSGAGGSSSVTHPGGGGASAPKPVSHPGGGTFVPSGASAPKPVPHPGGGTFIPRQTPVLHPGGSGAEREDTYDPKTDEQLQAAKKRYADRPESLSAIPEARFRELYGNWAAGPRHTPMEIAIGGQYAAGRHQRMRATSREVMRGLNINMPPGEFAKLTDAQLAQRAQGLDLRNINSSNVGWASKTVAMRLNNLIYARDLAREELGIHGGVPSAQMGGGFNTGTAAMGAAARTPSPASSPTATAAMSAAAATPSPVVAATPYAGGNKPSIEEMTAAATPARPAAARQPSVGGAPTSTALPPPPAPGTQSRMSGSYAGGPELTGRSGVWDESGKWRAT